MNKSSVRRALTTLKKNDLLKNVTPISGIVYMTINVPEDLIQPKKKLYKRKIKTNGKDHKL